MIKLIVSDFDGTLMPYGQKNVSDGVKCRIKKALGQNITVAVSSGRTYKELANLLPEFAESIYFICCDGTFYVKGGKPLYQKQIERADLAPFFAEAHEGLAFVLHGAFENYSVGVLPPDADKFRAKPIRTLGEVNEKIFKVTTYKKEFKPSPYSGLRMHWDGGESLMAQYVNRFANKGTALSDLQMRLMLAKYDTACIGDSGNDVIMMKGAKLSFAVGEKCPALLSAVNNRVSTAEEAFDIIFDK